MMLGLREEFEYVECAACGCLQIVEPPADLARYYPEADYYAQRPPEVVASNAFKTFLRHRRAAWVVHRRDLLGALLCRVFGTPDFYPAYARQLRRARVGFGDAVLDVGCGAGTYLVALQSMGFRSLMGVDPFLPGDREYPGVRIFRRDLAEVEGAFDFLTFHHSFEHLPDPADALRHVHRLLRPGRPALIRIPVFPSHAWREYGTDWVQLDAPRHLFLHSERSLRTLAEAAGLVVEHVEYDSTEFQFTGSERYRRDLPLLGNEPLDFPPEQVAAWARLAADLNARGEGDQAAFYLRRPGPS